MSVLIGLIAGFLAGRVAWFLLRGMLETEPFLRQNYRHHQLPTAGGLVLAVALLAVESIRALLGAAGVGSTAGVTPSRAVTLAAVLGFTLLGLTDDLGASGRGRGFRGHVGAMREGRITTGGLKLLGGGALALVIAAPAGGLGGSEPGMGGFVHLVVDALVIALAANLANLFDRAPGRVIKVSALSFAGVVVGAFVAHTDGVDAPGKLVAATVVIGASLAVLLDDLHERMMLGDTGANALGATVGVAIVLSTAPGTRVIVLVLLVILNALSEAVSFSSVIDATPPLRLLDRAGARPERRNGHTAPRD